MNLLNSDRNKDWIGVVYLARGSEPDSLAAFHRFIESYHRVSAGVDHILYIVLKGFPGLKEREAGEAVFANVNHVAIYTEDENFDIGAYRVAAECITHERLCFINTNSELIGDRWLAKLAINFAQVGVGLVGATGSFENLPDLPYPGFPNIHIRSNAFMLRREHALTFFPARIRSKNDAYLFESGPAGLTRRIIAAGLSTLVVGRDGRGYAPIWWPSSGTFRLGRQANLLVHDKQTRAFDALPWPQKRESILRCWGIYINGDASLVLPD